MVDGGDGRGRAEGGEDGMGWDGEMTRGAGMGCRRERGGVGLWVEGGGGCDGWGWDDDALCGWLSWLSWMGNWVGVVGIVSMRRVEPGG